MLIEWACDPGRADGLALLDEHDPRGERQLTEDVEDADPDLRFDLVCRACGAPIAPRSALFRVGGQGPEHVFANPHGQMRVIWTLRTAQNLALHGPPTTDYTWFAGYAWWIATCNACAAHLGWRFDARAGASPGVFFGLLKHALAEQGTAES